MKFIDELLFRFDGFKEAIAFQYYVDGKLQRIKYSELKDHIFKARERLKEAGFVPGDRIGIMSENSLHFAITYFAALTADLTPALIDPESPRQELESKLKITDVRALFVSDKAFEKTKDFQFPKIKINQNYLLTDPLPPPSQDPDPSIAALVFTSGTTGGLKAVMITQENFHNTVRLYTVRNDVPDYGEPGPYNDTLNLLNFLPWYHIFGLFSTLIIPLYIGFKFTLVDQVNPARIIQIIQETKPTFLFTVPRLVDAFASQIKAKIEELPTFKRKIVLQLINFSILVRRLTGINIGKKLLRNVHEKFGGKLGIIVAGGAPLTVQSGHFMNALGFTILEGYGLSESTGCGLARPLQDWNRVGEVGKKIPTSEVKISNPDESGEGEIWMKGPHIMRGYFRDQEATQSAIEEGWLKTGDLGRMSQEESVIITGRIKELITTSTGKKSWPHTIKEHYEGIFHVKEFVVLGMRSKVAVGDEIHAVVVAENEEFEKDIVSEFNRRSGEIPHHLRVIKIHFIKEIPKTPTLKVKIQALKEWINTRSIEKNDSIESLTDMQREVINILKKITGQKNIHLSDHLSEIGLDSLGALQLVNEIHSQYKLEVPVDFIVANPTVHKMADAILNPQKKEGPLERKSKPISLTPIILNNLNKNHIFLTGSTGVVGAYLLLKLIEEYPATIHCLVRDKTVEGSYERLIKMLSIYGAKPEVIDRLKNRVVIYLGDITLPNFGLEKKVYDSLTETIDLVIHSAAKVALSDSYEVLRKVNVEGTLEASSFALRTRQKLFVFISSYSVMGDHLYQEKDPFTEEEYDRGQAFPSLGYERTKFEAEGAVRELSNKGLKWMILRLGNVFGHSKTGAYPLMSTNVEGVFYDIFKTVIETNQGMEGEQYYDMTPIDYIIRSILHLVFERNEFFSTYHLVNPQPKKWSEILSYIQESGYDIDRLSPEEYLNKMSEKTARSITFELIKYKMHLFRNNRGTYADSKKTSKILHNAGIFCPEVNLELIQTYLKYCEKVGYLKVFKGEGDKVR